MSNAMIALTPILIFLIVALFGFVGCGTVLSAPNDPDPEPEPDPGPKKKSPYDPADQYKPPFGPHLPPAATTYESLVTGTKGFVAFWPLNETLGKVAAVVGPLSPSANGDYRSATGGDPSAGSYSLGKFGLLYPKDNQDFAAEFMGTEALIEVQFAPSLNPSPAVPGFTIELWAKPNPNAGADRGVVVSSHHFDSATVQQGYEVGLLKVPGQAHHQIYGRVYGGSSMSEVTIQPIDGDSSEWRHIVFKYEFVAGTGYVLRLRAQLLKGVQVYQAESSNPVVYENVTSARQSTFRIAGSHLPPPGTSSLFAGQLDNVAFYAAPLSDADINDHFTFV